MNHAALHQADPDLELISACIAPQPLLRIALVNTAAQAPPRCCSTVCGCACHRSLRLTQDISCAIYGAHLQVLAAAGIDSRRACERIIEQGRVKVNGVVVTSPPFHVVPSKDKVLVDGTGIQSLQRKHYFMVHKPKGYVCSTKHHTDEQVPGKPVEELLQPFITAWQKNRPVGAATPRLFTVGRMDQFTTGLMLLTNDGIWAQKVSHPRTGAQHIHRHGVTMSQSRRKTPRTSLHRVRPQLEKRDHQRGHNSQL